MSDTVISVEGLSKSYLIGHDGPQERYHSLRDTIVRHGKNYLRKAVDMARGRQIIQGDSVEEFWALKDVSFEVKRGEVLGIVGRNGAGKSTLLKILSRITEPTSGRVTLDGRVASLLEVGTGFHPELTGRENIFLNGAILGMTKFEIRKKFDEIVDFAGVEKFLDTPVKRYSSGMYVRLAFAVAAHLEPEILIIDEVLAVGDAEFQKKCLGKMRDVAKGGRTVIFVSHNLGVVNEMCENSLLLNAGSISYSGHTAATLLAYSRSASASAVAIDSKFVKSVSVDDGSSSPAISFGDTLRIQIHLNQIISGRGVNVTFNAEGIRRLFLISTQPHDGFDIDTNKGCTLLLTLPECFLSPGCYMIDVAITDPGFSILESIERAASFSIMPKAIGGHWCYESAYGDFFPKHKWDIQHGN